MKCLEMMYFMLKLVIYLILIILAICSERVIKYERVTIVVIILDLCNVVSKGVVLVVNKLNLRQ
jgi:hypothetical protein